MCFLKKIVQCMGLLACLLLATHAMAFTCPTASQFTNLEQYALDGTDVHVWVKYLTDAHDNATFYMVRPAQGMTYQSTMLQAHPQLQLACPSTREHDAIEICVYAGPHLQNVFITCADLDANWLPPAGTAIASFFKDD